MSQYPSPYYPPNVQPPPYTPYGGHVDLLAPAKRASILMFILGPLLLLCGTCLLSTPLLIPMVPPEQMKPALDQLRTTYQMEPSVVLNVFGVGILIPGIILLTLAFFVRRGGRVSTTIGLVVVGLILLRGLYELLSTLVHLTDPNAAGAGCGVIIHLGIFGLLFFWLIQAARAVSLIKLAQQQYMAQYYQYQQNIQAYAAYGYTQPQQGQGYAPPAISQQSQQPPTPPTDSPAPPPIGG